MNPIDLNGTWEGFYDYGEDNGNFLHGRRTNFTITLQERDGEFSGVCIDEDTSVEVIEATIKGFIQNNMISFVKQYPMLILTDDSGKLTINKNIEHPEIEYTGYYENETKIFQGEWEMVTKTVILSNDNKITLGEYFNPGTWQMSKKK